jgi:hypothetical protein
MVSRAAALGLRAALDTTGSGGGTRATDGDGQSERRGRADIGLNTGALPRTPGLAADPGRCRLATQRFGIPFRDASRGLGRSGTEKALKP